MLIRGNRPSLFEKFEQIRFLLCKLIHADFSVGLQPMENKGSGGLDKTHEPIPVVQFAL